MRRVVWVVCWYGCGGWGGWVDGVLEWVGRVGGWCAGMGGEGEWVCVGMGGEGGLMVWVVGCCGCVGGSLCYGSWCCGIWWFLGLIVGTIVKVC